jgi:glutamate dehydrogenase (NAD(P)+)
VGYHAAKFLAEDGAKIICVIERDGAIYHEDGLDVDDVSAWMSEHNGFIKDYPRAEAYYENGLACLEMDCDILIPAALENQITHSNAGNIKAPLIVEAANGPVTFSADAILRDKGTVVLPDVYVNAGGVTVSYFEWIKNLSHIRFGRMQRRLDEFRTSAIVRAIEETTGKQIPDVLKKDIMVGADERTMVYSGLDDTMRDAYVEISEAYHRYNLDSYRTAAFVVSLEKIALTHKRMGM